MEYYELKEAYYAGLGLALEKIVSAYETNPGAAAMGKLFDQFRDQFKITSDVLKDSRVLALIEELGGKYQSVIKEKIKKMTPPAKEQPVQKKISPEQKIATEVIDETIWKIQRALMNPFVGTKQQTLVALFRSVDRTILEEIIKTGSVANDTAQRKIESDALRILLEFLTES